MYIIYKPGPSGHWYWILRAANNETLATSETYSSKQACEDTAFLVGSGLGVPVHEFSKS